MRKQATQLKQIIKRFRSFTKRDNHMKDIQ